MTMRDMTSLEEATRSSRSGEFFLVFLQFRGDLVLEVIEDAGFLQLGFADFLVGARDIGLVLAAVALQLRLLALQGEEAGAGSIAGGEQFGNARQFRSGNRPICLVAEAICAFRPLISCLDWTIFWSRMSAWLLSALRREVKSSCWEAASSATSGSLVAASVTCLGRGDGVFIVPFGAQAGVCCEGGDILLAEQVDAGQRGSLVEFDQGLGRL